jgi:hypothetical protein
VSEYLGLRFKHTLRSRSAREGSAVHEGELAQVRSFRHHSESPLQARLRLVLARPVSAGPRRSLLRPVCPALEAGFPRHLVRPDGDDAAASWRQQCSGGR